ncbi:MAG TPA: hypothetical protein VIO60_01005 [Rectinemataceae bacterium]
MAVGTEKVIGKNVQSVSETGAHEREYPAYHPPVIEDLGDFGATTAASLDIGFGEE